MKIFITNEQKSINRTEKAFHVNARSLGITSYVFIYRNFAFVCKIYFAFPTKVINRFLFTFSSLPIIAFYIKLPEWILKSHYLGIFCGTGHPTSSRVKDSHMFLIDQERHFNENQIFAGNTLIAHCTRVGQHKQRVVAISSIPNFSATEIYNKLKKLRTILL